ncbi:hypothetical protein HAX54_004626 [Datura stramonium]|uniref:Uncharacterized protein n=1 Tax=Datura stramonium TaxID=4076 RepID=A0ABS8T8L1_DATST|nr:hypothetical protein [Datura stramonium]
MIQFSLETTSLRISHYNLVRHVVSGHRCYAECPLSEEIQRTLRMNNSYLRRVVGSLILITSCRLEIHGMNLWTHSMGRCENEWPILCARRFHNSSGLEVYYSIETSNESPVVTTREKYKAHKAAAATFPFPSLKREENGPSLVVKTLLQMMQRRAIVVPEESGGTISSPVRIASESA